MRRVTELTTPPRKPRTGTIVLAGIAVAVVVVALVAAGAIYVLLQAKSSTDQPTASAASATAMSVERQMECTGIKRGYDTWSDNPMNIGRLPDFKDLGADFIIKEAMEDGDALLKAVEGYDDQPSKALAVAVAEYNVEVSMLNLVFGMSGKYDDADYKKTIAARNKVRDAYNFFWAQICA